MKWVRSLAPPGQASGTLRRKTMRNLLLALMISAPISAHAQTAGDLARLSWGSGEAPSTISVAPAPGSLGRSGATAGDLVRLRGASSMASSRSAAPNADVSVATGGTARDLARLVGLKPDATPVIEAAGVPLATQIARPHG